tara:strand:- start:1358 stop:1513 length:156 start_codon:yes stop_codon:yes gene_type:complete
VPCSWAYVRQCRIECKKKGGIAVPVTINIGKYVWKMLDEGWCVVKSNYYST